MLLSIQTCAKVVTYSEESGQILNKSCDTQNDQVKLKYSLVMLKEQMFFFALLLMKNNRLWKNEGAQIVFDF